jgi:dihydrofolate reductase
MRELVYFISLSIDGFIAGPHDEVDFFTGSDDYMQWMLAEYTDALPTHVREQLGLAGAPLTRFDTVVMGRRTYQPALELGITSPYAHLHQVVFSRSLETTGGDVYVLDSDAVAAVRRLKAESSTLDVYLAGGGRLAEQLLPEIDRLVIKRYPVVAGSGIPAFGDAFNPTAFDLESVRAFDGGNVVESYRRPAAARPAGE